MAKVAKRTWTYKGEKKTAYVVRYVDDKGVRRSTQFDKFKAADTYRKQIEAELRDGSHIAGRDKATVASCCQAFLETSDLRFQRGQIGQSRKVFFECVVRKHIGPHLGAKLMADLRWSDLDEWQRKLFRLNPASINSVMVVLKLVEAHALKRGVLKKTVVREFKRDTGSAKAKPIRTFDTDTMRALIAGAAQRPKQCRRRVKDLMECGLHLAAFCGLRLGEIMGLTLHNIDFGNRVVRVRHSLTNWDVLKGPKTTSGVRDVPMPSHVCDLLQSWMDKHFVQNSRDLVFRWRNGTIVGPGNWRIHHWVPLLKTAGLWDEGGDQLHFHACRHFAASWMIEHGLALPDVASLMGHSKFDMTLQVYAHPIVGGNRRHEAFERMSGTLLATAPLRLPAASTTRSTPQG